MRLWNHVRNSPDDYFLEVINPVAPARDPLFVRTRQHEAAAE